MVDEMVVAATESGRVGVEEAVREVDESAIIEETVSSPSTGSTELAGEPPDRPDLEPLLSV